jgi:hypothetical protein
MKFNFENSLYILKCTPRVLAELLKDCPEELLLKNEGGDSWSPYDIVGHLIHGEKTDWIERMEMILSDGTTKTFRPFDRFAQFADSKGKTISQLLEEFSNLRKRNVSILQSKELSEDDLKKTGIHPAFGEVNLEQLLSTWTVHDLNHLSQITRVMAHQYSENVGPWKAYLPILHKQSK